MKKQHSLQLLQELWRELAAPDAFWQFLVLLLCLALASLFARWWRGRSSPDHSSRLRVAGARAAPPLFALLLLALAHAVLDGVIHVKWLALAMPFLAALLLVRIIVHVLHQSFSNALWVARSERWVTAMVWVALALHLAGWAPMLIGVLDGLALKMGGQVISLWMVIKGSLVVLGTIVLALWLAGVIETRLLHLDIDSSLRIVSTRVLKALLTLVALLAGLSLAGIDITALSVFTGALGVGLGLGLQRIASNYVSGFIILLDRSIRLGNVIQLTPEISGTVSEITTRYTVLKGPGGVEFLVPNELLVASTVYNQSYSDTRVRVALRVGVSYAIADLEPVLRLMEEVARRHRRVIVDPPPAAVLIEFGEKAIMLELGFWIADPQNGSAGVRSEIGLAIWGAFQEKGIEIPFLPVSRPQVPVVV